jgi:hypothetical protein
MKQWMLDRNRAYRVLLLRTLSRQFLRFATMKPQVCLLLALPLFLGFASCVTIDPGYTDQMPNGGSKVYNMGVYHGRQDAANGLSRTPTRYYGTFHFTQADEFNRGYEVGYGQALRPGGSGNGFNQPLTATAGHSSVTIREGNRVLCSVRTAMPNVEQTRWAQEQERIVVKSRGNHGAATIQLFDSRSGRELGRVMAYDALGGDPRWAAGMGQ